MAIEKGDIKELSGSHPKNIIKEKRSASKNTRKNALEFESLISGFSAALISSPKENLENELNSWLKKFVEFFKVDRCVVNEFMDDGKTVHRLLDYTVPDIDIAPVLIKYQPPIGVIKELSKGILIKAEKIPEDLPPVFRGGRLEETHTKSVIIAPLSSENRAIGSLLFASHRKRRKWSEDIVRRIKLIGEIIANAILRISSYKDLHDEIEQRKRLENRYSAILKNASVGFIISDFEQNILEVNDEYCRMSGYHAKELLSKKIWEIDAYMDPGKLRDDTREQEIAEAIPLLTSHIKKDGSLFDVEVRSNFFDEERIVFAFIRDITALNQARKAIEERLKLEELISEFSAALINVKIVNVKNELNIWLERFAKFLDVDKYCLGEFEDDYQWYKFISTYINPELDPQPAPFPSEPIRPYGFTKYLREGETIIIESTDKGEPMFPEPLMQRLREDGTKSILMFPLVAGDVLLGSMLISTIKAERHWSPHLVRELKLVAEIFANALMRDRRGIELDDYRKHLEKMVAERTARLEDAQKELVISEKMATLGRLTATVSHELRNPLATIRSSVYSVQKRLEGQNEKVAKALDRAERNIKRCDLIIEELLNFSRTHDLQRKQTPLDTWLDDILEEASPPAGITVEKEYGSNAAVYMDQDRFRQCMINILTNAYQAIEEKDVGESGVVRVRTRHNTDNIMIEISDNGIGFDMGNKDKLFEPLYSTKTFGVGLGLPIMRQIIEMHGWTMDINGKPEEGASVIITIPADVARITPPVNLHRE